MTVQKINELLQIIARTHKPCGMDIEWVTLLINATDAGCALMLTAQQCRSSCASDHEYTYGPHPYVDLQDAWQLREVVNDPSMWRIDEA